MTAVVSTGVSPDAFNPWLANKHWAESTLTYSFPTDGATYSYMATAEVTPLSFSQQAAVRHVLGEISGFTGLTFTEITESTFSNADFRFATDPLELGGYAYLPTTHERGGDAFFGTSTENPVVGNEGFLYFTHEIGHAMGLNHGHEFPVFANSDKNSQEFTVVTYTDYIGDDDAFSFDSGVVDWAQSYMQLDIAAMQFLYGANYSTSGEVWSGDTTYSFNSSTGEISINSVAQGIPAGNRIFRTIWDGDGDDTYDFSNYDTDLEVNLSPGGWSVLDDAQLADLNKFSSDTSFNARGNVANALLVDDDVRGLIENAIGGSGDDTVSGNGADNILQGKGGYDTLTGKKGDDTLLGNGGKDTLKGGTGADVLEGGDGKDKLVGNKGADTLKGGHGNDRLIGGTGKDEMRGNQGDDVLIGGTGKDTMYGNKGADTFKFNNVDESKTGSRSDIVKDFTSGKDALDFASLVGGLELSISGSFSGTASEVITKVVEGNTRVLVDVDGDGTADFRVILEGVDTVVAGDFLL